jgi:hypothetical protein
MKYKIRYDKDVDIAMIILSKKKLAYEREIKNIIVGFSEDNQPIWLEIMGVTRDFLPALNKVAGQDLNVSEVVV